MNSMRWNIAVSPNSDQSVRIYLAGQGGGRKGNLSRFIEEAVRAHILELSAEQAKSRQPQCDRGRLDCHRRRGNTVGA